MKTNHLNQIVVNEDDIIEVLYRNATVNKLVVDQPNWIKKFNKHCDEFELSTMFDWQVESELDQQSFVEQNFNDWNLPEEYQNFDIEMFLFDKCDTIAQIERVQLELNEFENRNMIIVLKWLKYFVDTLRSNNMIWGVGRGSSVSSYVLFLLELHRVDSIKYNLDIKEFLK
jgi:DNA polymerase III alpha subunit